MPDTEMRLTLVEKAVDAIEKRIDVTFDKLDNRLKQGDDTMQALAIVLTKLEERLNSTPHKGNCLQADTVEKLEKKVDKLELIAYSAIGMVVLLQALIPILIKVLFK